MTGRPAAIWLAIAAMLAALATVPASSLDRTQRIATAEIDTDRLRSGDLVFRAGRGWEADAVRAGSFARFSHVGLIERTADGAIFVIHAAPPEDGGRGYVERVPLAIFNDPGLASDIVFYRPSDLTAAERISTVTAARAFAARRIPFDEEFDTDDDSALYCTELVLDAFHSAGAAITLAPPDASRAAMIRDIVFPADLLRSAAFAPVPVGDRS
ncbi:YiiX/YebB-like N1pC/P60 family cysteine hydrolase [Parasphingopyxis sp.]|uniref:YiiX/YebB-like N1pC/P60 family cysteine hydrolase n=1 Tax=Parasphingopyxis sp. TaxID=1920299 RepID=UPI0026283BBA|nr:YiiX/YebB-like N1pC/P60 family cysteine hydrolase [Parasphingopyxis sp.]